MKITQRPTRTYAPEQHAAMQDCFDNERACQEAWHAASYAKPFDKAAEIKAWEALQEAENATKKLLREMG